MFNPIAVEVLYALYSMPAFPFALGFASLLGSPASISTNSMAVSSHKGTVATQAVCFRAWRLSDR